MVVRNVLVLLTIILPFVGCSPYKYKVSDAKHHIKRKSYVRSEDIHLQNYVVCNNINRRFRNKSVIVRYDSVLNILSDALEKSGIKIIRNEGRNFCDSTFHFNTLVKLKKIDINKIISIANYDSTLTLIPVIYINNRSIKNSYITSSGIPDGGYYLRDTFLTIAVYLIKDNEIVYLKSAWFGPVSSRTATYNEEPLKKLEQEHWDKLVRLVMNDYIDRLE